MNCGCGRKVEDIRIDFGYRICAACAHEGPDVPRPKGRMVYGHKTAGEIEILSAESWESNKKYFIPNGARSALKNFSRNICA
tara:strand:- start:1281 stop:1526 length:246 start_codon:yes stop_codon:yes gene_type:complete